VRNASTRALPLQSLARIALIALVLIGTGAVIGRAAFLGDMGARLEPARVWLLGWLDLSDPLIAERADDIARFDSRFRLHPVATVLHIASGGLFLVLVPLQLWRSLRMRHRAVHRVIGRISLAAGVGMVLTALYFGILMPFAGAAEAITMAIVSAWYAFASVLAVIAIRHGDTERHREWMLRAIAVPLGVSVIRIAGLVLELVMVEHGLGPELLFQLSIWSGWLSSILAMETWIRATRSRNAPASRATPAGQPA
jgi:uncharacterized membrane protein